MGFEFDSPDVRVSRRSVLWFAVPLGVTAFSGVNLSTAEEGDLPAADDLPGAEDPGGSLGWTEFLAGLGPLADKLAAAKEPNESAYLHQLAGQLARLGAVPETELSPFPNLPGVSSGRHHRHVAVSVLEFEDEPHGKIPLHDHAGYNGVMLGLEGEFRVQNYERVDLDSAPTEGKFRLRQTTDSLVTVGRIATLSTRQDNFHELTAGPEGGRALDVFTFLERGKRGGFYERSAEPIHSELRIYEAERKDS